MFSVLRRFAYHPDRVRVTFTHFSELNLVAIRRVYLACHRPEPDHRPEPGINRRRRVRHAQATGGVNR
jgi:hypothetical protein